MAESNVTKRALAGAIKELMHEMPFSKINIAHICERCNMNRKSFYYHFKDKYDLVNWIFDTEFIGFVTEEHLSMPYEERFEFLESACEYFYTNRHFYRKALQIKGQNSFSDHFREFIRPLLKSRFLYLFGEHNADDFVLDFFTDAIICALERWLLDENCISPKTFMKKMEKIVISCAEIIHHKINTSA